MTLISSVADCVPGSNECLAVSGEYSRGQIWAKLPRAATTARRPRVAYLFRWACCVAIETAHLSQPEVRYSPRLPEGRNLWLILVLHERVELTRGTFPVLPVPLIIGTSLHFPLVGHPLGRHIHVSPCHTTNGPTLSKQRVSFPVFGPVAQFLL